jgi:hypothetical protein
MKPGDLNRKSMSSVERNTAKWLQRTASTPPKLKLLRGVETKQPLSAALLHCVDLLQKWTGAPRTLFKGLPGMRKFPPQEIPFTIEAIEQYVSENLAMTGLEHNHAQVFRLQDTGKIASSYSLGWSPIAYIDCPGLHSIEAWLSIDEGFEAERYRNGEFADFFGRLASGAYVNQAFFHDRRTDHLYVGPSLFERRIREDPPDEHDRIPPLTLPEDLELYLPQVRYDHELNLRMVPEAVWWLNYWSATIVDNIGRDRILTAPWAATHEMPGGALLLEATRERLDVSRRDHCQRLREICSAIDLIAVQERFLVK